MRTLILCVMAIACAPLFSQEWADSRERRVCLLVSGNLKCQSTKDERPEAQAYALSARVGDRWWPGEGGNTIQMTFMADQITGGRTTDTRLVGHVEIVTATLHLEAEQAVFHPATGRIETGGF